MASEWDSNIKNLRFSIRKELCSTLDHNRKWADLAGKLNYSIDNINTFGLALMRLPGYNSPTDELLSDWEHQCPTLDMLYRHLIALQLKKQADIISKHVESENRKRGIDDNRHRTSTQNESDDEIPSDTHSDSSETFVKEHSFQVLPGPQSHLPLQHKFETNQSRQTLQSQKHMKNIDDTFRIPVYGRTQPPSTFHSSTYDNTTLFPVSSQTSSVELGHVILYEEIKKATYGFDKELLVGEGAFGEVYKGYIAKNTFAIKKLKYRIPYDEEFIKRKMDQIRKLCHQNLIQMIGYSVNGTELCVVCEFMVCGSLENKLRDNSQVLDHKARCKILIGVACALQYLHNSAVTHGDIKSANILLDQNGEAKLSDLGQASMALVIPGQNRNIFEELKAYMPPEYRDDLLSEKGDVYSFGIVILECCTGEAAEDAKRHGGVKLKDYIDNKCGMTLDTRSQQIFLQLCDTRLNKTWPIHIWCELFQIGQDCTVNRKKARPLMTDVYQQLQNLYPERLRSQKQALNNEEIAKPFPEDFNTLRISDIHSVYNNVQGQNRNFYYNNQQKSDPKFSFDYSTEQNVRLQEAEIFSHHNKKPNVMGYPPSSITSPMYSPFSITSPRYPLSITAPTNTQSKLSSPSELPHGGKQSYNFEVNPTMKDHLRNMTVKEMESNSREQATSIWPVSEHQETEILKVQVVDEGAATNVIQVTAVSDTTHDADTVSSSISGSSDCKSINSDRVSCSSEEIIEKDWPSFFQTKPTSAYEDSTSINCDRVSYSSDEIQEKSWPPFVSIFEDNDNELAINKSLDADVVRNCDRYRTIKQLANEEKCISDPGVNTSSYQYHMDVMVRKSTLSGPQASSFPVLSPPIYTG